MESMRTQSGRPVRPLIPALLPVLVCALVVTIAGPAQAGGFFVYDVTGEAVAKGSAVVASTSEPAAVWYNPAALSFLPGYRASIGGVIATAGTRFSPAGGGDDVSNVGHVYFLPHLFATAQVIRWLHVGLGVFSVFGLGTEWPSDWLGRESSIEAGITTVTFNPAVSFRLHDMVSLAVGFDVVRAVVDLTNGLPPPVDGTARIAGAGWGFGGNVGLLVRPIPDVLHIGLTWRSRVFLSFDGRADFDPRPEFASSLPDQGGSSKLTLPDIYALGVLYKPIDSLELTLDVNVVLWNTYDETVLRLESGDEIRLEHHYEPSFVLRVGADWATPVDGLHVRGGFIFDQSPAPSEYLEPSLPDSDQVDVTIGLGYSIAWFKADVGYQFIYYLPAEATTGKVGPEGTYRTIGHFVAITLSVAFGTGSEPAPE